MNARSYPVHECLSYYRYLEKWVLAKVYFLGVHENPFIPGSWTPLTLHGLWKLGVGQVEFFGRSWIPIHTPFMNASFILGTWKSECWPSCIFWVFMNVHLYPVHERLWPCRDLENLGVDQVVFFRCSWMPIFTQFMNASYLTGILKIGCWPSGIFWVFMNARSYPVHECLWHYRYLEK